MTERGRGGSHRTGAADSGDPGNQSQQPREAGDQPAECGEAPAPAAQVPGCRAVLGVGPGGQCKGQKWFSGNEVILAEN